MVTVARQETFPDEKAWESGIEGPEELPNKAAVIAAIEGAESSEPQTDLAEFGARVISVCGPKSKITLVAMPTDLAIEMFRESLGDAAPSSSIEAVEHDLALIAERSPILAQSAHAATAMRLAYELENPYNSATSKSQCAKVLNEAIDRLLELAPTAKEDVGLDALNSRRAAKRASTGAET